MVLSVWFYWSSWFDSFIIITFFFSDTQTLVENVSNLPSKQTSGHCSKGIQQPGDSVVDGEVFWV